MVQVDQSDPPGASPEGSTGILGSMGGSALGVVRGTSELAATTWEALRTVRGPGSAARREVRTVALQQVMFTGFDALGLVSAVALFIGATLIIQTGMMAPAAEGELLGRVLVAVIIRELAPLITAIIVASRSGTAIAVELGNMRVNAEILALSSLGIDPPRFIVLPRLLGVATSVVILCVYFAVVAVAGGFLVAQLITDPSFGAIRAGIAAALVPADLALFLLKGVGLGVIVGSVCCHHGLRVRTSPTEVPRRASRAVMLSLLGCVVFNALVTAGFYWLVGPPIRA